MPGTERVLIIDDEVDMCWILDRVLRKAGYEVVYATSAKEALILAKQWPVQAAIVDCKLTDMDGLMLTEKLKSIQPDVKILLISGYHFTEDSKIEDWLRTGVVSAFISKPFEIQEIRDSVSALTRPELALTR